MKKKIMIDGIEYQAVKEIKEPKKKAVKKVKEPVNTVKGFKATHNDLTCNNFQYKVGEWYKEDTAELCRTGFHFCENPLDVLDYYDLCDSKFFEIEADEVNNENEDDNKRVAKRIKLKAELGIKGFVNASFKFLWANAEIKDDDNENKLVDDTDSSQVATSGYSSKVATSGYSSKVATSGNYSQVATSGDYSKVATSGNSSQVATSGDYSQVATSGYYSKVATSGYYSKVATSGNSSKVDVKGEFSVGANIGIEGKAKGIKGNWLTLAEWEYNNDACKYKPLCVKSLQIDGKKIKEDTWYKLKDGEFTEC